MKKVLIVVDMQKDFVNGSLGSKEAEAIVDNVVKKIRNHDGLLIATLDTHYENYLETAEGKKLPIKHCIKGSAGWTLDDRVAQALENKKYTAVEKNTFGSVDLPQTIKSACGDEEFSVELIGLCTDICVVSNALILKAVFPEISVSVDADCCAGVTPQSHSAALTTMKACQIDVIGE
ncbi:MAG: cysteine hydrolase [Lachnospiraceae bacterium]|nr:cysteine hydrolase [Lachnospiraceae bacterium]